MGLDIKATYRVLGSVEMLLQVIVKLHLKLQWLCGRVIIVGDCGFDSL